VTHCGRCCCAGAAAASGGIGSRRRFERRCAVTATATATAGKDRQVKNENEQYDKYGDFSEQGLAWAACGAAVGTSNGRHGQMESEESFGF
jgi:hypothetical protein